MRIGHHDPRITQPTAIRCQYASCDGHPGRTRTGGKAQSDVIDRRRHCTIGGRKERLVFQITLSVKLAQRSGTAGQVKCRCRSIRADKIERSVGVVAARKLEFKRRVSGDGRTPYGWAPDKGYSDRRIGVL